MAMDAAAATAAAAAAPQPSPMPLPEAGTGTYVMGGVYVSGSSTSFFSGAAAAALALVCTVVAVVLSVWHIWKHLQNYTEPTFQRYIVRIIFMVPVYSCMSFGALVLSQYAMYFNTIRDVYEAWVIYNFLSLCLAWVGGPGAVVTSLTGRLLKPSYILMTCCLPPIPLDGRFIRRCKQGCLQFVYLKPILATLCLILYSYGLYTDGNFSLQDGYLYITGVYMLSYTGAIYSLILFYVACKDLLRSFNPVPKFLMIKAVVFLTYWQGVVVFTVAQIGLVNGVSEAADLQNVLICIEMALGAVGFLYAFPYSPFMQANVGGVGGGVGGMGAEHLLLSSSIKHAMNLNDVVSDTVHQFAPTYHDYVLYSDGSQDVPHHYRTRTFVPVGAEMEAVRKAGRSGGSRGGSLLSSPSGAASSTTAPAFGSPTSPTRAAVSSPRRVGSGPAPVHGAAAAAAAIDLEAAFQQQGGEQELGGSASGGSLASQGDLSQGSTPRLPPPPQDIARSSGGGDGGGTSRGGSSVGGGGSLTGAGGGSRRGTNESMGSAGTGGGHRTSSEMGSESTSLRRPARKQDGGGTGGLAGVDHHFDGLLVDEDDLVGETDSSRDLEGFVSR